MEWRPIATAEVARSGADPRSLAQWLAACCSRDEAIVLANGESQLSMSSIAAELGLSVSRVSRIIAAAGRRQPEAKGKT